MWLLWECGKEFFTLWEDNYELVLIRKIAPVGF